MSPIYLIALAIALVTFGRVLLFVTGLAIRYLIARTVARFVARRLNRPAVLVR